jgi:serine/threonine protein kinase
MIGQPIGAYRVTGKLGIGGMGVVYDAEDTRLPRRVALKFLPPEFADDPDADRRLLREAETIASLNHPNICTVYGVEEHAGQRFIAMERLDGTNLKMFMARQELSTPQIVDIAQQIGRALAAAHGAGIVHRDIKPGNIMVAEDRQVKVLDFGLARRFRMPETGELLQYGSTIPGRPLGTANYMAPERILQRPLDPRCDLFSLGVVIYEMATGRLPFAGTSPGDTVTNVLDKDPMPLRLLSPNRPAALERVVQRLLAKEADDRFQSAEDLLDSLKSVVDRRKRWWGVFRPR